VVANIEAAAMLPAILNFMASPWLEAEC
jgi:hypothetical protein